MRSEKRDEERENKKKGENLKRKERDAELRPCSRPRRESGGDERRDGDGDKELEEIRRRKSEPDLKTDLNSCGGK